MADYLVLEEDGTSHLQLEESTDDFLLEESSPHERAVSLSTVATITSVAGTPPAVTSSYKGGRFTVPGSTGNKVVTGVGFQPDAVIFIGSNSATEDSVVTGNNLGVFMGFMGRHYNTGSVMGYAISLLPEQGRRTASKPIVMSATWNTQEYAASAVSLDADGFTVNFDDAGTGVIYWLAIKTDDVVIIPQDVGGGTYTLGFVGKSMLTLCARSNNVPDDNNDVSAGLHHLGFGGGGFVDGRTPEQGGGFVGVVSGNAGRHEVFQSANSSAEIVNGSGTYTGPFLSQALGTGKPSGTGNHDFALTNPPQNVARYLVWDAECANGFATPATGVGNVSDPNTVLINSALERSFAMVGYTIADSPQSSSAPSAVLGLSLSCEDSDGDIFQASVFCDGVASPKTLFQSPTSIVADVDGSNVHTSEIDFLAAGPGKFRLTTLIDGTGGAPQMVFHAFGVELPIAWIPQSYRRRN